MKVLTVYSQKGGCGKTSICTNIAAMAAGEGRKTAILDLDPQGSASVWGDLRQVSDLLGVMPAQYTRLEKILSAANAEGFELIVLDLPPKAADAAMAACNVADIALIPVEPEIYNLAALSSAIQLSQAVSKRPQVILNKIPLVGTEATEAITAIRALKTDISPVMLHHRKPVAQAQQQGLCVVEYVNDLAQSHKKRSSHTNAAVEMRTLWGWVSQLLQLPGIHRQVA